MIVTALIRMVLGIVDGLLSLLPDWNIDSSPVTSFTYGTSHIVGSANGYVPERLTMVCLALLLGLRLFMFAWAGIVMAYRLIPFNG